MERYDVAVVGGGPIGGYVAKKIASEGAKVALFEEHKKIGKPLKCAGLVTKRVFDFLDFPKEDIIQNEVYGAHIHSPLGNVLTIGGDRIYALVIDRLQFDKKIIKRAKEEGAEVYFESRATSAKKSNNSIELDIIQKDKKKQISISILIGADGSHSTVRKLFKFPQPAEFLRGIGAEVTNTDLDPRMVEIFLGENIAPGFFGWIIPTNREGSAARVGLCIGSDSKKTLKQCFTDLLKNPLLQNVKITEYIGGSIPLGALNKTVGSNVMLVGDAAAQIKPTSGGGIYTGLLCASYCSSVAIDALNINNYDEHFLKKYHKQWYNEIGKELSLGMKFRAIFKNLNDEQIDRYIKKFNNKKIMDILSQYGDIDYPSKLVLPLLKKSPTLLKLLPSAFKK